MVYESDFYTTRRPYRATPSLSTYTVSSAPSRQIRIIPSLGKVHVVHAYDRIVPYDGHKRLTVVTVPPHIFRVRPSVLMREFDRIERKVRPVIYYSPTNHYLNTQSSVLFDDETRLIRAQAASLRKRIHAPVPRAQRSWPVITSVVRYDEPHLSSRISSDNYIYRLLTTSSTNPKTEFTTYYTEPVRKYIGPGHLSCVRYAGERGYSKRPILHYQDPVKNDIQLLSYYITKFRNEKAHPQELVTVPLSATRPSRIFTVQKPIADSVGQEIRDLREARAVRLAKIHAVDDVDAKEIEDKAARKKRENEEARIAEEKALVEEGKKKKQAQGKKEEAARKAELARQEELAAQAAADRAAEIEKKAELVRQEESRKQAELDQARKAEEERQRVEEEKRQAELVKQEEERQQLLRLEEIARQAEAEKEAELARQAEELAELARQEAELAELARQEAELAEQAKREAELAELARQEAELADLERQEKELAEQAIKDAEAAESARQEAELAELRRQEEELAELEKAQAELDALEAEAKAMEQDFNPPAASNEAAPAEDVTSAAQVDEEAPTEVTYRPKKFDDEDDDWMNEPVVEEPVTPTA